jgi:hypothetical protein
MGLSVYIHSLWIPSLLDSRKKPKSLLLTLGCFSLVVRVVNMPMVNRRSVSCFKFSIQNKGILPQQKYDQAIKIIKPVSAESPYWSHEW